MCQNFGNLAGCLAGWQNNMKASNFWKTLKKPIIGLAPMDGVTDGAMREITDIYGRPDVIFTEFVPVMAIKKGIVKVLHALKRHQTKTPLVAQFFGNDPDAFYQSVFVAAELGFSGVDINMGCPARSVAQRGGGAGLIKNPKLAQQIIIACKKAVKDWKEGRKINKIGLSHDILNFIQLFSQQILSVISFPQVLATNNVDCVLVGSLSQLPPVANRKIPISVKTRIGYDKPITEKWIGQLLEVKPDAITVHGRTLKQLYHGKADWEEIAKAAKLAKKAQTLILGNGDVKSIEEAKQKVKKYKVVGALIGRTALVNPWVFSNKIPTIKKRFQVMLEHTQKFLLYRPDLKIFPMRKHMAWYCKGFDGAAEMRNQLMKVNSIKEIKDVLSGFNCC